MRVTRAGGFLRLQDRPGPYWALGLFFLFGAGLALAAPLGLASNAADLELWERAASVAIGLGVGAGGVWWFRRSSSTRAEFDLARQRLTLMRIGLQGRRVVQLPLSDIVGIEAERGSDGDGGVIWRAVLRLGNGERVALSELWSHNEKEVQQAVRVVAEACRLPQRGTHRLGDPP
jgi:hypothetical protein